MYIWVCSRSDGAGSATTRNTRGLTRSVRARIVPPLPAVSRPSNTRMARYPSRLTHSWSSHSSACSLRSFFRYAAFFMLASLGHGDRLAEQAEAVDEEHRADGGHHREGLPHRAQAASAVDDDL